MEVKRQLVPASDLYTYASFHNCSKVSVGSIQSVAAKAEHDHLQCLWLTDLSCSILTKSKEKHN